MRRFGLFLVALAGCDRVPYFLPADAGYAYELPQADDECAVDLQCMTNGCGNHCTSTDAESFGAICIAAEHLETATCGCVDRACQWYVR